MFISLQIVTIWIRFIWSKTSCESKWVILTSILIFETIPTFLIVCVFIFELWELQWYTQDSLSVLGLILGSILRTSARSCNKFGFLRLVGQGQLGTSLSILLISSRYWSWLIDHGVPISICQRRWLRLVLILAGHSSLLLLLLLLLLVGCSANLALLNSLLHASLPVLKWWPFGNRIEPSDLRDGWLVELHLQHVEVSLDTL